MRVGVYHPQEIGFLSPKPVVYVANIPPEALPSEDSEETEGDSPEASESAAAIARVALAHADRVTDLRREVRVPTVAACLRDREGQDTLGAAVRYQHATRGVPCRLFALLSRVQRQR